MTDTATPPYSALSETLAFLGYSRIVSHTLAFLVTSKEPMKSHEIEAGTGLRQPEVSTATRELLEKGWITKTPVKKEGKGRTPSEYRLAKSFAAIIDEIDDAKRAEMEKQYNAIQALRAFAL